MTYRIPRDTWRGAVAQVLNTEEWMDAHDVSRKVTNSPIINRTLSKSGASRVLSDMNRHGDVLRREVKGGESNIQFEYRLREEVIIN